jgi:ribonuclease/clavin/mitogillin
MGINLADLKHFLITHYHPDHAGLAQELKRTGCKLILVDLQEASVPTLRTWMKPENHYVEIDLKDAIRITLADSRTFLKSLGVQGEIIHTPGHSDDSVTLVLDEGAAFVGDFLRPEVSEDEVLEIWQHMRDLGVKRVYPGHGPVWPLA